MHHQLRRHRKTARRIATPQVARSVVASSIIVFIFSQVLLASLIEWGPPWFRDPEYAVRRSRLLKRMGAGPQPIVAFGSSRLAEALRPSVLGDDPPVFNFGIVGAGPVQQRLALRRLLRDGIAPRKVLFEYWPPYFLDFADQREEDRLDRARLNRPDLPDVEPYVRDPANYRRDVTSSRILPVYSQRFVLVNWVMPLWLPFERRQDFRWRPVTADGWLPGKEAEAGTARTERLRLSRQYYEPFLTTARFDPVGERAFDDLLANCASMQIDVILLWLPESSEFRSWYAPAVERLAQARFAEYGRRHGVRLLDGRRWSADERLGDGFHLDPAGAVEFTRRLASELFP